MKIAELAIKSRQSCFQAIRSATLRRKSDFPLVRSDAMKRSLWPALVVLMFGVVALSGLLAAQTQPCVDYSKDPAGCQPSTLDTPIGLMPSVRVNRQGVV